MSCRKQTKTRVERLFKQQSNSGCEAKAKPERSLVVNPLHVLDQYLLAAAVIEFRGPAVRVTGDSLSGFQGTVVDFS